MDEFLLARIAEDPAKARDNAYTWLATQYGHSFDDDLDGEMVMVDGWLLPALPDTPPAFRRFIYDDQDVRQMCAYYSDHTDYQQEWNPLV